MKLRLLFLAMATIIFSCTTTYSQSVSDLNESFEGSFLPTEWVLAGGNAETNANWDKGISSLYFSCAHSGSAGAVSESYIYTQGVHPNNWLITPALDIVEGDSIIAYITSSSSTYYAEHAEIRLSTGGTDTASFNVTLWEHTFSLAEANNWQRVAIPLNNYANQTIRVAFIHNECFAQNMLMLDDVQLKHSSANAMDKYSRSGAYFFSNNILHSSQQTSDFTVEVIDLGGRSRVLVSTESMIDLSWLPKGFCLLRIRDTERLEVMPVIIF